MERTNGGKKFNWDEGGGAGRRERWKKSGGDVRGGIRRVPLALRLRKFERWYRQPGKTAEGDSHTRGEGNSKREGEKKSRYTKMISLKKRKEKR